MLFLKNIYKSYTVGNIETKALRGISLGFRSKEFVAILGVSGSGKTTALNIIGGLDRYDTGDLIIKGKHTQDFKDKDWDAYRNNSVGFVFQSYNLINHLSIVANVELSMTLSGVGKKEKQRRAIEVLERVGLKDHLHKKPNQLSGGQQQRVAIARALVNNPEILLCDEPTGALDTETSQQIMELIQEIAADRLVIMVTHNPELAHQYANRIVNFKDGQIESDTNPLEQTTHDETFNLKHTSMSFFTALRLSFNNILTKKGRTFLTSFASSIGIIGIAVILSLSTGFQLQIDNFQADAMSEFPIMISQSAMNVDPESFQNLVPSEVMDSDELTLYDPLDTIFTHENKLDQTFLTYLESIDPNIAGSLGYTYMMNLNFIRNIDDSYTPVTLKDANSIAQSSSLSTYPINLGDTSLFEKNYDVLAGDYPRDKHDVILITDNQNRFDINVASGFGLDVENVETLKFDALVGQTFYVIPNDLYYEEISSNFFIPKSEFTQEDMNASVELRVAGILRLKEDAQISLFSNGFVYSDEISQQMISSAINSKIVVSQKESNHNVLTQTPLNEAQKEQLLSYLGGIDEPYMLTIYPKDFESKEKVLDFIDSYNEGKASEDVIVYTDLASTISSLTKGIMDGITIVLVAFASISLVVSLIMIGIITYTSVLERTKEIGILKALGARKKDITRVFDAETFILGVFSGSLGIATAYLLTLPINKIIYALTDLNHVATLRIDHAISLIIVSTVLTMLGGHIPAKMASKKDAVIALRSE